MFSNMFKKPENPPKTTKVSIPSRDSKLLKTLKDKNGTSLLDAMKKFMQSPEFKAIQAKASEEEVKTIKRGLGETELRNHITFFVKLAKNYGNAEEKSKLQALFDSFKITTKETTNGVFVYAEIEDKHIDPNAKQEEQEEQMIPPDESLNPSAPAPPPPANVKGQNVSLSQAEYDELIKAKAEAEKLLKQQEQLVNLVESQRAFIAGKQAPPGQEAQDDDTVDDTVDDPEDLKIAQNVVSTLGGKKQLKIEVADSDDEPEQEAPPKVATTVQNPIAPKVATPVNAPIDPLTLVAGATPPVGIQATATVIATPAGALPVGGVVAGPGAIAGGVGAPGAGVAPPPPPVPDVNDVPLRSELKRISQMKLMDVHEYKLPMSITDELKLLRGGNHLYPINLEQPKCNPQYYRGLFY